MSLKSLDLHILETFRNAELHSLFFFFFFPALNSKSDQESSMLKQDRMKHPKMKKEALVSWSLYLRAIKWDQR